MTEAMHETDATKPYRGPQSGPSTERRANARTCVGCGRPDERSALVRLVLMSCRGPQGGPSTDPVVLVAVDSSDGGFGRGAHVHPRPDCLARAASGGLARAAKSDVRIAGEGDEPQPLSSATLTAAIAAAAHRRFAALLGTAKRAKHAALGSQAVEAACREGAAKLLVVATDAAAAADLGEVRRAVAEGRAVAWGTKRELCDVLRPARRAAAIEASPDEGIAVVAVTDDRLAAALKETMVTLDACAATRDVRPGGRRSGARGSGSSSREGRKAGS